MADKAYRVKADTSFPLVQHKAKDENGDMAEVTVGHAFAAGDYLLGDLLTERDAERAENGELDHLLEEVDVEEAVNALNALAVGTFIPEHEVERFALVDQGHRVVEKDQLLELRSAGEEAAKEALEASQEQADENTAALREHPAFTEVSSLVDDEPVLPKDGQGEVPEEELETSASSSANGVEMPPGLLVGPAAAKAAGADAEEVDKAVEQKSRKNTRRKAASDSSAAKTEGSE